MKKKGVLLVNLGTPDAPTPKAVRQFLKEFLSDPNVVILPRLIWLPILYLFILPTRSKSSAELYKKIWTPAGSPLKVNMEKLVRKLQLKLGENYRVILGMRYGNPSIQKAENIFKEEGVEEVITLPLYPQYSFSTAIPGSSIHDYHDDPNYIQAIAECIKQSGEKRVLFSFHGLPEKFINMGDVYYDQCMKTAKLVAEKCNIEYAVSFQSRLGRGEWIKPYTSDVIKDWPTVICPGFAVDCLETLEEIVERHPNVKYISALNDSDAHANMLVKFIENLS